MRLCYVHIKYFGSMNLKTIETDTGTIVIKPNRVEVKLKAYTVLDKTAMLEYLKVFKEGKFFLKGCNCYKFCSYA